MAAPSAPPFLASGSPSVPGPSVPRRRRLLEPARLTDVDRNVGQRAAPPGAVPVHLTGFGADRVPNLDPLRSATPDLHPSGPLDDVEHLPPFMRVPVVPRARLEANNDGRGGECWLLRCEQLARSRPPREVGRVQRLEVGERPIFRCDLHASKLTGSTTGVPRRSVAPG